LTDVTAKDRNDLPYRTVAISRADQTIIPHGNDAFNEGDMVYVITSRESAREVMRYSGRQNIDIRTLMILGGSRIGAMVAREFEDEVAVKLVEYNAEKAYKLAEMLDKTLIINDDGRNIEAMIEEGLATTDAFVAVTGRSETNILAAMVAKKMGVKKVIAEVENMSYISLAESIGVDTIINKKLVTASSIFRFTMKTDVQAIKYLTGSEAEVLEFIAKPNSPATRGMIRGLDFPRDAIIGGIVRGDEAFIAKGDSEIRAYDRVVVFSLPDAIEKVGRFFN
jgi:trk system potassium uptake protein TrkA